MPPQDVKRNNDLSISISNKDQPVPIIDPNWTPPSGAIDPNWTPPVKAINPDAQIQANQEADEGPSPFQKGLEWANKPLVNVMSPYMQEVTKKFGERRPDDTDQSAYWRGMLTSGMSGLSDIISAQSSPLGMALEGTGALASGAKIAAKAAAKAGDAVNAARYGKIASKLMRPGQVAGAGMVGQGLYNAYEEPDWVKKAGHLTEAGLGGLSLLHLGGKPPKLPEKPYEAPPGTTSPIIYPNRTLGPAREIQLPSGNPTIDEMLHGRTIEPKPEVPKTGNEPVEKPLISSDPLKSPDNTIQYTAGNLAKARKIIVDYGIDPRGMADHDIIDLADSLLPGAVTRKIIEPDKQPVVIKPKMKITDYWIDDPNTGKKILNPKYQVKGLTTSEPAVEAEKAKPKKIPYFIEDKTTGKWIANPEHPDIKAKSEPQESRLPPRSFVRTMKDMFKSTDQIAKEAREEIRKMDERDDKKRTDQYNSMPELNTPGGYRPSVIYDPGSRLTPEELETFKKSPTIEQLSGLIDKVVDNIIESTGNENWRNRLEKTGIVLHSRLNGIHIPNVETGHSMIGHNPFPYISRVGPKLASYQGIITLMHETAHIGLERGAGFDPTTGKQYSLADWQNHPHLAAYMEGLLQELHNHADINPGHAGEWMTRLGDIYGAYGPDKFFEAAQQYHDIITGPDGKYTPEIQELLSIYKDSRGRDPITEDFISRTGERKGSSTSGESLLSSDDKANGKRANRREPQPEIVDKLIQALKNAGTKRLEQDELYTAERARRIANANKADTGGLRGFYKQLHELKGELPKVSFSRTKLGMADVNDLINAVGSSPYLTGYEKVRAKMGLLKMLSAKREELPQPNELALLHQVFGDKFKEVIQMHGGLGAAGNAKWEAVKDIAGMQKSLMASMDMSALFRQGGGLMFEPSWQKKQLFRPAWKDNIIPMVKMFGSKDYYNAAIQAIRDDPMYVRSKEAGLKLAGTSVNPNSREEAFPNQLANKIPGVGGSERAYVGFLDKAKFDTFKSLLVDAEKAGLHPNDVQDEIANFINTAAGRGTLPGKMDRIATDLNAVFFSPRLIASRLQMMNPQTYIKASPFVRRQYINSMLGTVSASLTMTGLMSMLGAKTYTKLSDDKGTPLIPIGGGTDMFTGKPTKPHGIPYMPIDADFGKSKFGNTRLEMSQGYLPYLTFMGRMLSGERESSTTGKMYILGKGFATPNRLNVAEDFVSNKFSPAASLVYKILKQKDPQGNEYKFSPTVIKALEEISRGDFSLAMKNAKSGEIVDTFIPMFLGDLAAILKDDPHHWPAAVPSFFGSGVQTYGKTPPKTRTGNLNNLSMPPMR